MCRALEGSRWDRVFGTVGGDLGGSENRDSSVGGPWLGGKGGVTFLSFLFPAHD